VPGDRERLEGQLALMPWLGGGGWSGQCGSTAARLPRRTCSTATAGGRQVLSRSADGTVRRWDWGWGECVAVVQGGGAVAAPAAGALPLTRDEFTARLRGADVVAAAAGTHSWRLTAGEPEAAVEDRAGRPVAWFPAVVAPVTTHPACGSGPARSAATSASSRCGGRSSRALDASGTAGREAGAGAPGPRRTPRHLSATGRMVNPAAVPRILLVIAT
jgi:hypothetical protein